MALKVNLCGHPVRIEGYINIDLSTSSEISMDLEEERIPLDDESADVVVCNSALNYFSAQRGRQILRDVFRILRPGGVTRFGTLDMEIITRHYLERNEPFYFEKLPNGADRYPGQTFCEKLNEFFSGHAIGTKHGKFVYDAETLALRFAEAGFVNIERKQYRDSAIPEVGQIDNRPEQMFFLEAFKPVAAEKEPSFDPETAQRRYQRAVALTGQGQGLKAWQQILAALDADIRHEEAAALALARTRGGRPSSGVALLRAHLRARGQTETRADEQAAAVAVQAEHDRRPDALPERDKAFENRALRRCGVTDDQTHLDGCLAWLARAQDASSDGGVSAMYDLRTARWDLSYPETTGYIIPTCLAYAALTGDRRWVDRALTMGEFLRRATLPGGGLGEPVGLYAPKPRVFNTAQAMLGFLALFRQTGRTEWLAQARSSGNFILENLGVGGAFVACTYAGNKSHKARVAWPLLELWRATDEDRWREAALAITERVLENAFHTGWFANTSLSLPNRPWTHFIGYTLAALEEIRRIVPESQAAERIDAVLLRAAEGLTAACAARKQDGAGFAGAPGTFDWNWRSRDTWSCVTGNAQLSWFLQRLSQRLGRPEFGEPADWLLTETKKVQFSTASCDANLPGGVPGADPLDGGYLPGKLPNWAAKFFADALLLHMQATGEGMCLG